MAGIKRFITYIYAYEEGRKGINTGFAKIEVRENECRIEGEPDARLSNGRNQDD